MSFAARKFALLCVLSLVACSTAFADADQLRKLSELCDAGVRKVSSVSPGGAYQGEWDGKLPHLLAIVEVVGTKVVAYYSTGVYIPWGIKSGYCGRVEGVLDGDRIRFPLPGAKAVAVYTISNNVLKGTYSRGGYDTPGTFTRVSLGE